MPTRISPKTTHLLHERPRERLFAHGAQALSLPELLAILLSPGTRRRGGAESAQEWVRRSGDHFWRQWNGRDLGGFLEQLGLGPVASARVLAAAELGRRAHAEVGLVPPSDPSDVPTLPRIAEQCLERVSVAQRGAPGEWFGFIPLWRTGRVGRLHVLARTEGRSVQLDWRAFLSRVLALDADAVVLMHNHPSGQCTPSAQDLALHRRVGLDLRRLQVGLVGQWIVSAHSQWWVPG